MSLLIKVVENKQFYDVDDAYLSDRKSDIQKLTTKIIEIITNHQINGYNVQHLFSSHNYLIACSNVYTWPSLSAHKPNTAYVFTILNKNNNQVFSSMYVIDRYDVLDNIWLANNYKSMIDTNYNDANLIELRQMAESFR